MKAAPFRYVQPSSLAQTVRLLTTDPEGTQILAGGQSLMPALVMRERTADVLLDVSELTELRGLRILDDGIEIGAAEPLRSLECTQVADLCPLLRRAVATVAAMAIRSRCTIGGSLAWADPTSQLPAALAASRARVTTTDGTWPLADFIQRGPGRLAPGEVIISVRVPSTPRAGVGLAHVRRTHITWPAAGAAALCDGSGTTLALYGAGPTHVVVEHPDAQTALSQAVARARPFTDERVSARYREQVLPVLARRAVTEAQEGFDGEN